MTKNIPAEKYFSLCTGGLIKDIKGLVYALDHISDQELYHHVTEGKNDFSTWINDVFGERTLAQKLSKTKDRKDMQITLLKHLVRGGKI